MDTSTGSISAPGAVYELGGHRFEIGSPGFAEVIANAHAARLRPRCLCVAEGVEMYVARLAHGHIVKRLPDTGSLHAPTCPSYELPPAFSGLGQKMGTAIIEDLATGHTTLKLDFALSRLGSRLQTPAPRQVTGGSAKAGSRLSMRALLHYLWDQAELTRWHPGFEGKRSWGTVRHHLLQAAAGKLANQADLHSRLYVPEVFRVEQRDTINARRVAGWTQTSSAADGSQRLMLLIAELKELAPARFGARVTVKHVPDQLFALDDTIYRRLLRSFDLELRMWGVVPELHMVIVATFGLNGLGVPTIAELSLMPVDRRWLPVQDTLDCQLLEALAREDRHFVRCLRFDLPSQTTLPVVVLTDAMPQPIPLFISRAVLSEPQGSSADAEARGLGWTWHADDGEMPCFPRRN